MFRSFTKRGILLVFITAVILGIILFLFFNKNLAEYAPVKNNIEVAYHDELEKSDEMPDESEITEGSLVGTLKGNGNLELRYGAEYTDMVKCASVEEGSLGGVENAYVRIINSNADKLGSRLEYSGVYGKHIYELEGAQNVDDEAQALHLSADTSSLIIYYQKRGGVGLTNDYKALIYKEVG